MINGLLETNYVLAGLCTVGWLVALRLLCEDRGTLRRNSAAALVAVAVLTAWVLAGCEGLRFVQTAEEAKDFHPKSIGVLPADVGIYKDAQGKVDGIIPEVLTGTKWYVTVVGGEEIRRRIEANEDLRKSVDVYLAKLRELNFSDPELCKAIAELCGIEAVLIPTVDVWEYTMLAGDKIARVGISMRLVDTNRERPCGRRAPGHGRVPVPEAGAHRHGRSMIRKMVDRMPH